MSEPRREFLMLAKKYIPGKSAITGRYVSEKLDGTRVFWDGGVSRGVPLTLVPWANLTHPKTGEPKANLPQFATGLYSRYANPIMAPDWFLNELPSCPLDGELWAGRGGFQRLRSIVARNEPDERWHDVQFAVFGSPPGGIVWGDGLVKNPQMVHSIQSERVKSFLRGREASGVMEDFQTLDTMATFETELAFLRSMIPSDGTVYLHTQRRLSDDAYEAEKGLETFMGNVLDEGGEGIIIRDPRAIWTPKRVGTILKYKPFSDDQGTVTGFVSGRKTDKGSKLLGMIGALILDYKGQRLELSGLTDEERQFDSPFGENIAILAPGKDMPAGTEGKHFKVGDTVEFRYRELSDTGIPKEARYLRRA